MQAPAPEPAGSSPPTPRRRPIGHLCCTCQLRAVPRLALCGTDVTGVREEPNLRDPDPLAWCTVCRDLGRTVLVARRCERCPT